MKNNWIETFSERGWRIINEKPFQKGDEEDQLCSRSSRRSLGWRWWVWRKLIFEDVSKIFYIKISSVNFGQICFPNYLGFLKSFRFYYFPLLLYCTVICKYTTVNTVLPLMLKRFLKLWIYCNRTCSGYMGGNHWDVNIINIYWTW